MSAATAIVMSALRGAYVCGQCTIDPGSINAGVNEDQTIAVPECKVGDVVVISPQATLTDGLVISQAGVFAAGTITFTLENHTGGAINQGSTVFSFALFRGAGALFL